jgi:hypothetical protein
VICGFSDSTGNGFNSFLAPTLAPYRLIKMPPFWAQLFSDMEVS